MLWGTMTAIVTPFSNGQVDVDTFRNLVERQIAAGIHGLVVCGTTGEAANLTIEEQLLCVRHAVEQAKGRVPIIAGTGTNNSRVTMELTRKAAALRVDGVLVVTPYYIKPTQAGLISHFEKVAQIGPPVVAYNVPGRTGVSLTAESVAALARIKNVVALKEASADLKLNGMMVREASDDLAILSGDDFTYLPQLAIGGSGCISVVSNVAPADMVELTNRWRAGDVAFAREIHLRLLPLMEALFCESNPIPVKAAMALMGLMSPEVRPPLTKLSAHLEAPLRQAMRASGVLEDGS